MLCLHGFNHSSTSSHRSSVYFQVSPMKFTNDSNYQAGDINTEDSQELDDIEQIQVSQTETENKPTCEAEQGEIELTTVESKLTEENMDGDEKKSQVYSPSRKPKNGGNSVTFNTIFLYIKYFPIVIRIYQQVVHIKIDNCH